MIRLSAAEAAQIASVMTRTRDTLTAGASGLPAVVSAELFDSTPTCAVGAGLNALGLLLPLQDGIILKSPNGTLYKLTVSNGGAAVFTAL